MEGKKIVTEMSGFYPIFEAVLRDTKDLETAAIHGVMWRFCQMEDGVCKASLETIADAIGLSRATVIRRQKKLVPKYFTDITPDLRNEPHVFVDTGAVKMKSKLYAEVTTEKPKPPTVSRRNVRVSRRNVRVSRRNVTVSGRYLNKDSNKEKEEQATRPELFTTYEQEIGIITAGIATELMMLIDQYSEPWIIEACKIASERNKRSLAYVRGILNRWRTEGRSNTPPQKSDTPAPQFPAQPAEDETEKMTYEEYMAWKSR